MSHGHGIKSQRPGHSLEEVLLDVNSQTDGKLPYELVVDAAVIASSTISYFSKFYKIVFIFDIVVTLLITIGGVCDFKISTFSEKLLTTNATIGFDLGTSMIDVIVVDGTRWWLLIQFFIFGPSCCQTKLVQYHQELLESMQLNDKKMKAPSAGLIKYLNVGWWMLFSWTMWSITKVSMLDWKGGWNVDHPFKMWTVVVSAIFSVLELKYTNDLVSVQQRAFDLRTLLLTDLSAMMENQKEEHEQLKTGEGETKLNNYNKQVYKRKTNKSDHHEDARSRFYDDPEKKRAQLLKPPSTMSTKDTFKGLWKIMRAYAWPNGCSSKIRIFFTFIIMAGSKLCSLLSPLYIGLATQKLADDKVVPYREIVIYCTLQFFSIGLGQLQKIVYLGVKQHAFAEIATTTFRHLHSLSLDWHLQKKMGTVLRIMDRGIASADQVMNYLVLYLLPSIVQAFVVFGLFYVKFNSAELAGAAFLSFVAYCVITIQITMWRKKFRKATNKHDNKYHDLATDSLVNFETVKYFANEEHEISNFRRSVEQYQKHNIATQVSLAVLNSAQQLDIQITTTIALMLAVSVCIIKRNL